VDLNLRRGNIGRLSALHQIKTTLKERGFEFEKAVQENTLQQLSGFLQNYK
jgi:hypothetical protein